ncbi:Ulp1 protease [Magnaporthiopsis poae ATCC 64411]|uniref:Ulp1 protease n=1 Tax=Magnaporthiopsis poae (strain ATCC 64411 / 73-15) TaxID=644358 RepID=A0A0C4DLN1_MAGP6|nr:Ulp1 protease [Magnaporthiopsis poae ATCC 64411]
MPATTGKRPASSSEAELRAALQEGAPTLWGWAQTALRSVYTAVAGVLRFGAAIGGSAPAAAADAAQTILVVETSASSPSGDTWVKRRKATRDVNRGEVALRKTPVRFPSGFDPKNRKFPRRRPVFAPVSQPPVGLPVAVAARAVEQREEGQLGRPAAAAAIWRRPAVAQLKRLHIRREVASRPLREQGQPKTPQRPVKGILKHSGTLRRERLRRQQRVQDLTARRRVVFKTTPLPSPAPPADFNWRGHFRVPSPSPSSSDSETEEPSRAGPIAASTPLSPSPSPYPAPDLTPISRPPQHVTPTSYPAQDVASLQPSAPGFTPIAVPDLRTEDITPIASRTEKAVETRQPIVSTSAQAEDAPQTYSTASAMDSSSTMSATKRPSDSARLAQTPMRQAPARNWNSSFQTPQPSRADVLARTRQISGSSSRLPPKLFRPGLMASQRVDAQAEGPVATDTDVRTSTTSNRTTHPPAPAMRGSLSSTAPDRMDVDISSNPSIARTPYSALQSSTRRSRFRAPSHATVTPRKKSIDVHDFSLIGESPESTAPPTPETKPTSPEARRKEILAFFADDTRNIRVPAIETEDKVDSPNKMQQSPSTGSPNRAQQSPITGSPNRAQHSPITGSPNRAQHSPITGSSSHSHQSPTTGSPNNAQQSPITGSPYNAQQPPITGSPNNGQQSLITGSPAHSPDNSPRHSTSRSSSSSPAPSQPNSPQAPSHTSSPLAPSKPEDDLDFPSFPALTISSNKDDELACAVQLRIEAEEEEERERARRAEEAKRKEEAERLEREEKERLERSGGLRLPNAAIVQQVSEDWHTRILDTLRARETTALARSAEGTEILGRDFRQVVPPTVWLNDEIINSSLSYVAKYVNDKTGTKNAVKCVLLNSYFWKHLTDRGPESTQRWLRRLGVNQGNYLSVETFLIPINLGNAHWTLGIVRPKQGIVAHIDSLGPQGAGSPRIAGVLLKWVQTFLGPHYDETHWKIRDYESPSQTNSWDCGVHSITNGFCIALDIDPSTYQASDMPQQRLRLAGVLLNGGFTGDFDISDL